MNTQTGKLYDTSDPAQAFDLEIERELTRAQGLNPDEIIVPIDTFDLSAAVRIKHGAWGHLCLSDCPRTGPPSMPARDSHRRKKRQMARASRRANRG